MRVVQRRPYEIELANQRTARRPSVDVTYARPAALPPSNILASRIRRIIQQPDKDAAETCRHETKRMPAHIVTTDPRATPWDHTHTHTHMSVNAARPKWKRRTKRISCGRRRHRRRHGSYTSRYRIYWTTSDHHLQQYARNYRPAIYQSLVTERPPVIVQYTSGRRQRRIYSTRHRSHSINAARKALGTANTSAAEKAAPAPA